MTPIPPRSLIVVLAIVLCFAVGSAYAQPKAMVVHLPEAPMESMGQLGAALTQFANHLASTTPNLALEVKAFRKGADALEYMQTSPDRVAVVLSDVSLLADVPASTGLLPVHRFVRGGQATRRKLVVVKTGSDVSALADLRGRSITVAQASGAGAMRFLSTVVFGGQIEAETWFGSIATETDDFTATAAVLYDRTDAALVSEDNPLLKTHLGKDLREIYASGPVSMSVISVRPAALSPEQLSGMRAALDRLSVSNDGVSVLADLKVDELEPVRADALFAASGDVQNRERTFEIALPVMSGVETGGLPPADPSSILYLVGVELAEVPIPPELVDAVLDKKTGEREAVRDP